MNGLSGADAAPGADPDRDGRANLIEYSLGSDPTLASTAGEGLTLAADGPGRWIVRYPRNRQAAGITAVVENSSDLTTWTALPGVPVVESSTETLERLALGFDSAAARVFVRLRLELP